jgi:hypothetical protein
MILVPLQRHAYAAVAKRCAFLAQGRWLGACAHLNKVLMKILNQSEINKAAAVDSQSFRAGSILGILVSKDQGNDKTKHTYGGHHSEDCGDATFIF